MEFRVADCNGFVTVGEYDDGRPGELFINVSKQGSTLAGIMDAFAISVSHGLQYGVPLETLCNKFAHTRFEPQGFTTNRDILFDWSEFTYNDAGLWLNSSQVDMFAVPHAVTVTGAGGVTKRTGDVVAGGRNAIINRVRAQSGWASAVRRAQPGHHRECDHRDRFSERSRPV